ncbi:MAG: cation:proton antiporter [Anaerolineae bacterium]|nr:cation:proton antiporter [Anaerolineae bacterium]
MTETLELILAIAIVIAAAKLGGYLATRLRQPAVLGELLMGLILGPSVINLFGIGPFAGGHSKDVIYELAEIGVIFLMFVAGLEVDLEEMLKSGKVSLLAGNLGVLFPLLLGAGAALVFGLDLYAAIFVGLILTATSVSISAQTLLELGVLRTKEGLALLGAAVVDDVVAILALSVFLAITGVGDASRPLWLVIVLMVVFFVAALFIASRLFAPLTRIIVNLPISQGLLAFVITVTLIFAWAAEVVGGVAAITGAFIAGVFFGRTAFHQEIERGMHTITYSFFVPIFLVSIGLRANIREIDSAGLVFLVVLIIVAVVSKVIGSGLGARLGGFDLLPSFRVGLGMVSRGEVGLIITTIGLNTALVTTEEYSQVVIMVLVTTLVTPLLLRWAYGLDAGNASAAPAGARDGT